jgi:DNA-binding transcriptional MerR regulator
MPVVNLPEKRYYTIGEVADAFGVNSSLIRFWEKEFNKLNPKKNSKGDRRYTPADVAYIELIFNLVKERGFTLEGAKQELSTNHQKLKNKKPLVDKLKNLKAELISIKEELQK